MEEQEEDEWTAVKNKERNNDKDEKKKRNEGMKETEMELTSSQGESDHSFDIV